ncbi:MAG: RnfABCDGE type electron transport complex subunit G [Succinivibrionaceae bacterium]|nr:RnfABCDGE type electron transport complex subunit G [Succinivibrionaceae bacterium]
MSALTHNRPLRAITAGILLCAIGCLCVWSVLYARHATAPAIEQRHMARLDSMAATLLPVSASGQGDLRLNCRLASAPGIGRNMPLYIATSGGKEIGYIVVYSSPRGYSNPLLLIAGMDTSLRLGKVDIHLSRETPGIGDKVDRRHSDFLDQFTGRALDGQFWEVRKSGGDFDYISGATVTSRAIVTATADMLKAMQNLDTRGLAPCKGGK